jgi:hypothetical protein
MADKRISQLNPHTSPSGSDLLVIVNNNETKKITYVDLIANISGNQVDISGLNAFTQSFNTFSSSVHTEILAGTNEQDLSNLVTSVTLGILSGSVDSRLDNLELHTGSYVTTSSFNNYTSSQSTSSLVNRLNTIESVTSSYETKGRGIVSGSSQLTSSFDTRYTLSGSVPNIPTGSFATTGSNQFNGNQSVSGSLTTAEFIQTSNIQGTGSLYLKPDSNDSRYFEIYNTSPNDTHIKSNGGISFFGDDTNYLKIEDGAGDVTIRANQDITIQTGNGNIVLNPDGNAYIGSANAGNGIVTDGYLSGIIGDTNTVNNSTGHTLTDNLTNIINSIPTIPVGTISGSQQISDLGFVTGAYTTINSFNSLTQSFNSISQSFTTISGSFGGIDLGGLATTGSNTFKGDETISGSLFVSGATELGGNIVPKTARGATLGTVDRPFRDIFVSSGSINIASDTPGVPNTQLSNVSGNILISAGGIQLLGTGSFNATTGSFQYLSGSFTHIGAQFNIGDIVTTGSLQVSGSTIMVGNNTMQGNTLLSGSFGITGSTSFSELGNTSLLSFSSSLNSRINAATNEQSLGHLVTTSSFNSYTASISTGSLVTRLNTIESVTSSYETKGRNIVSSSAQITSLGFVSGSFQANWMASSGSSQILNVNGTNGPTTIAIGRNTGLFTPPTYGVAIGNNAGESSQGEYGVAIGNGAGQLFQGTNAVAIGSAGYEDQGQYAVAIGSGAGDSGQGEYAIAIGAGAGANHQTANSIILDATNGTIQQAAGAGLHIAPIRSGSTTSKVLNYNTTTKEITYITSSFETTGRGIISGSSQLTSSFDTRYALSGSYLSSLNGAISSSSQVLGGSGIYSSSAQLPSGLISGSSQLTASYDTRYTLSGSVQPLPSGLISGSSQLTSSYDTRYSLSGSILNSFSSSVDSRLDTLEATIITGSINYTQVLGNRRTSINSVGTSIISGSITTTGNPVQIMVTGDSNPIGGTAWARLQIYRDGNAIGAIVQVENSSNLNVPYCLNVIDTPSAGTYSYSMRLVDSMSGTFDFGEAAGPILTAVELKSNTQLPSGLISGSSQLTSSYDTRYTLSGSVSAVPSGTISGSSQLTSSFEVRGSGIYSSSAQLPSGLVSGSSQILGASGIYSSSAQLPSGLISGSSQLPTGLISGSSQLTASYDTRYTLSGSVVSGTTPAGTISGSSQLTSSFDVRYETTGRGIISGSSQLTSSYDSRYTLTSSFNSFTASAQAVTTGSNTFNGTQTITGSLNITNGNIVASQITANTASLYLTSGSNLYVQNNGLVEITGSLVASGSTISLITTTLQIGTGSGDEGGEILLVKSQTNNSLTGSGVTIDSYQNRLRIFEQGGNARGVHIDLTKAPDGVNGELLWKASGMVNAGTFVTLDNLKATVTSSSNRGLSLATVSGTVTGYVSGHYQGITGASAGTSSTTSLSTSATTSLFGWNFASEGDMSTYILRDNTNNRIYRIIMIIGASYNNNFISIERLY